MFAFDAAMRESYVEYALTPGAAANVCDLLRDQTAFLKRTTPTELASYAERARKKLV
ncbi:MAG: hypothetical protein HOV86_29815 [Thermoactinospora sp.]|nr:hypothetical protein [Thermoactinospora sp.]